MKPAPGIDGIVLGFYSHHLILTTAKTYYHAGNIHKYTANADVNCLFILVDIS